MQSEVHENYTKKKKEEQGIRRMTKTPNRETANAANRNKLLDEEAKRGYEMCKTCQ